MVVHEANKGLNPPKLGHLSVKSPSQVIVPDESQRIWLPKVTFSM